MHTLSGLLHADHRIPSLDYKAVMKATFILTKNAGEIVKNNLEMLLSMSLRIIETITPRIFLS